MNKKINKILIILALTFLGTGLFWSNSVFATATGLTINFQYNPLFKEADLKPGDSISRWVEVINNTGETKRIVTEAINYPGFPDSDNVPIDDLSRALMIVISKDGTNLYGSSSSTGPKSLYNFYQDSENYLEIYLSDIDNGATIQYDFTISFPYEAGNYWQGKTTGFDILIGSQGETNPTPPSPPSPPSSGGGALPQGLSILNEDSVIVTSGSSSATIVWTTNYLSTSQVVYDTIAGKFNLSAGPSNYGYTYSTLEDSNKVTFHTVTITGLTPGTTYYYRVVSHASPPTISTEHKFFTYASENYVPSQIESGSEEGTQETTLPGGQTGGNEGGTGGEISSGGQENGQGGGIVEGQGGEEERTEQIILGGGITSQGGEEGFTKFLSSGLASIIDALRKILGERPYLYLFLIFIILFLLWLILILLKRRKRKEENN